MASYSPIPILIVRYFLKKHLKTIITVLDHVVKNRVNHQKTTCDSAMKQSGNSFLQIPQFVLERLVVEEGGFSNLIQKL